MTASDRPWTNDRLQENGADSSHFKSSDVALELAPVRNEGELRVKLAELAGLISDGLSLEGLVFAEIAPAAAGGWRLNWQTPSDGLSLRDMPRLSEWAMRAERRPNMEIQGPDGKSQALVTLAATSLLAVIVYPAEAGEPAHTALLADMARLVAATLERLRDQAVEEAGRRAGEVQLNYVNNALALDADILWEASANGVLHCRRILNRNTDLAALVEGLSLSRLMPRDGEGNVKDRLAAGETLRQLAVRVPEGDGGAGRAVRFSGMRNAQGGFFGTLMAEDASDERQSLSEAASLMNDVSRARKREERHRREAEIMLEGLRLLLGNATSRERLEKLVALLKDALRAEKAVLVERAVDDSIRLLVPRDGEFPARAERLVRQFDDWLAGKGVHVLDEKIDEASDMHSAFDLPGRDVAIIALPLRSETAYLVCAPRGHGGFDSADLDFAARFNLLLQQAFQLREEQSQLAQTAKMAALGQMSASIAHELRQPLNTISMSAQNLEAMLESPDVPPDSILKKAQRILAQVERANEVVTRLRRFGRKGTGSEEDVALATLAENVSAIMGHVLMRKGVRIEIDVPEGLAVSVDPLQIEQVLTNLLQNATDAMSGVGAEAREGEKRITILSRRQTGEICLDVLDTGPGFPDKILDRAAEPFFTTKPSNEGTGLGLAICDAILREHGGRLDIGNRDEGGGRVTLVFPA
ncbi:signal transduction histidine kinase [Parvibaculum indicum]|uniref:sensor histidine kinase n=1 Tax=Parvibaculum indicum TaxID=562969 RepID=UPI0014236F38|nr:ATP-binding protein [Parvibaculum indicum]NIJ43227.1 signal transduction histidine kinase [Parvibaculum indicum]